ncbi:MAG: YidB family protein, partial [Halioglobus sp.]
DIIETGAEMLIEKLGLPVDVKTVVGALSGLLGDGSGGLDLSGLAGKLAANGDLGAVLGSWLGDGANTAISADTVLSFLGEANIGEFAGKIGTDAASASNGLADIIPQMMDESSSGGKLLDSVGGIGGIMGAAKSFLT